MLKYNSFQNPPMRRSIKSKARMASLIMLFTYTKNYSGEILKLWYDYEL